MEKTAKKQGFIRKADIILAVVLLLICAALILPGKLSKTPTTAVIYSQGQEIKRIDLENVTERYTIPLNTEPAVTITVEQNCIYYSKAECKDKLCVNFGKLSHPGDTAACLPSQTLIVLEGKKSNDQPDVMTY